VREGIKVRRLAPGEYEVTSSDLTVNISRYDWLPSSGPQWVARAAWDQHIVTDPLWTLADAKRQAEFMIGDAS
jgi:hypothetical protein